MNSTAKTNDDSFEEIRLEWQEIARTEVVRQRRRLARLTPEQQLEVQSVLVSVANGMFDTLLGSVSQPMRKKYRTLWRPKAALA